MQNFGAECLEKDQHLGLRAIKVKNNQWIESMAWDDVSEPSISPDGKSKRELGVSYRSLVDSMNDFFQQMVHHGLLEKGG